MFEEEEQEQEVTPLKAALEEAATAGEVQGRSRQPGQATAAVLFFEDCVPLIFASSYTLCSSHPPLPLPPASAAATLPCFPTPPLPPRSPFLSIPCPSVTVCTCGTASALTADQLMSMLPES